MVSLEYVDSKRARSRALHQSRLRVEGSVRLLLVIIQSIIADSSSSRDLEDLKRRNPLKWGDRALGVLLAVLLHLSPC